MKLIVGTSCIGGLLGLGLGVGLSYATNIDPALLMIFCSVGAAGLAGTGAYSYRQCNPKKIQVPEDESQVEGGQLVPTTIMTAYSVESKEPLKAETFPAPATHSAASLRRL